MNTKQLKIHSEFRVFLDYITRLLFKLSGTNQKNWGPLLSSKVGCHCGSFPSLASQPPVLWWLTSETAHPVLAPHFSGL